MRCYYIIMHCLAAMLLVVLFFPRCGICRPAGAVQQQATLALSSAERKWLADHPHVRIGVMNDWPPLNYSDANGAPQGIGSDYIAAINKRLGGVLVPVPAPFKTSYEQVLAGRLDALMDITQRPDREALFAFSKPYITIPHVIVGRKNGPYFSSENDLTGRSVALERGFYNITHFRNNFPKVTIKEYYSTSAALDAVAKGEADAYAGNRAVVIYLLEKELIGNLRLMGKLVEPESRLQFGVRKANSQLATILDKALAAIPPEEERALRQKWLEESAHPVLLTSNERAWLNEHPVIRVAFDPDRPPVEFIDDQGAPAGIAADYLKAMEKMLGVRFEIARGTTWQEMVVKLQRRELDMITGFGRTPQREQYLSFTSPYISVPYGIFTRHDSPYITSMDELKGKKIGLIRGYVINEMMNPATHPAISFVPCQNISEALQKLVNGQIDAYIGTTLTAGYYIARQGYSQIKLAGLTPFRSDQSLAVRNDWPMLAAILSKALQTMPESEKNDIYTRWISVKYEQEIDYRKLLKVVAGAAVLLLLVFYWNRKLAAEITVRKQTEKKLKTFQEHLEELVRERTAEIVEKNRSLLEEISERKQAEQALKASEERYRTIIELAADTILQGDRQGNIIGANKSACQLTGYAASELIGMNISRLFAPEELQRVPLRYELLKDGRTIRSERRLTRRDGTLVPIEMNSRMMPDGSYQAFIRDMSEHEAMQAEQIKVQKLESLGVLAGGIAHDFNNILTGILGNISFARMFLDGSHRSVRILAEAENASKRAADLAFQLLTFARGSQPIKKAISLKPLVEASAALVLSGANVRAAIEIPESLHPIEADGGQISQVCNNLIINAAHAMVDGGTINIRADNCCLNDVNPYSLPVGEYVRITFSDTGCGIPEKELQRIFEPYFTTKAEGSGLGLASVHSIVTKHGGHINVASQPGQGTTFTILLPASDRQPDENDATPRAATSAVTDGCSLLIMDDEEIIRTLTAELLEEVGYRTETCTNGEEAIALYGQALEAGRPFSAVIMDLTIRDGMGGKEAAGEILKLDPKAKLVVSSGYSNDPVMANFTGYGFSAAIVKPYNASEIIRVLSELLARLPTP